MHIRHIKPAKVTSSELPLVALVQTVQTRSGMFRVSPVQETEGKDGQRKVSFSPDVENSYRHQVVGKIRGLMEEVQVIHEKEEKHLKKVQEQESFSFKQKQELELQAFLKKQKEEAENFRSNQTNTWSDLKERHTQETWRLFGKPPEKTSRGSITSLWGAEAARSNQASPAAWNSSPATVSSPWNTSSASAANGSSIPSINSSRNTSPSDYWNSKKS